MDNDLPVISSHLPDMVDQYVTARAQRLTLQKQVDEMEALEKSLKATIIAKMRDGATKVIGGVVGFVKLQHEIEPVAEEWPKVWAHIQETGNFDLLHKRLTITAVRERWDAGEEVPGVGRRDKYDLSVSKS